MKNLKVYNRIENRTNYGSEIIENKKEIVEFITIKIKGQIVKLQRNPKLTYEQQITSFCNRYKLSIDNIKEKNKKLKFVTELVQKQNKNNSPLSFQF